jgi:hypothetical protein
MPELDERSPAGGPAATPAVGEAPESTAPRPQPDDHARTDDDYANPYDQPRLDDQPRTDDEPRLDDEPRTDDQPRLDDQPRTDDEPRLDDEPRTDDQAPEPTAASTPDDQPRLDDQGIVDDQGRLDDQAPEPVAAWTPDDQGRLDDQPRSDDLAPEPVGFSASEPVAVEESPSPGQAPETGGGDADSAVEGATVEGAVDTQTDVPDRGTDLRERWREALLAFVDSPRDAVERADRLVEEAVRAVTERIERERTVLREAWRNHGEPSTEELRLALRGYRDFFEKILTRH